ncbi:MAG: type II secretion system protein N [Pseudomonadota bacterium]
MRTLLVVLLVLLVVTALAVTRIPARLAIEQLPAGPVQLVQPAGTLWQGQARLFLEGEALGLVSWDLDALALGSLTLAVELSLNGSAVDLSGPVQINRDQEVRFALDGSLGNALLVRVLAPYDIRIDGDLELTGVRGAFALPELLERIQLQALSGALAWDGGLTSYTLQNGTTTTQLPPLSAQLALTEERQPEVEVYTPGVTYPVLFTSITSEQFVKIGVTRRFTEIARMPWPGSEPDHAVVLEVEQQLF